MSAVASILMSVDFIRIDFPSFLWAFSLIDILTFSFGCGSGFSGRRVSFSHRPCGIPESSHNVFGLVTDDKKETSSSGVVESCVIAFTFEPIHTAAKWLSLLQLLQR